jgi:predicted SAM-dependent methyltransferase
LRCLNLGCGERFHPEWANLDLWSCSPKIQSCDLRQGIPAPDESFDVVYHSHLLEHLDPASGLALLRECWRVLRKGGMARVAVPDLEQIAKTYLHALDEALKGDVVWQQRYDWMMLEMYDQSVRHRSGGGMLEYFRQKPIPAEDFVLARLGGEARRMTSALKPNGEGRTIRPPLRDRVVFKLRSGLRRARRGILSLTLGDGILRALDVGRFRLNGEIHQWMYDRYSLGRALEQAGFRGPIVQSAHESLVPDWCRYCLDTEPDGSVYKPDSLFMEAIKP